MIRDNDVKLLQAISYPYNIAELLSQKIDGASFTGEGVIQLISDVLTDRGRQILEMVFRDGMSYANVGKAFHVTRERVRQILDEILRELVLRAKEYAAVPYKQYEDERAARKRAEEQLCWFLRHGEYKVILNGDDTAQNDCPSETDIPLQHLDLSVRAYNCLTRAGYRTVTDILKIPSEEALLHIRNLGVKSVQEVLDKVHSLGYKMAWEVQPKEAEE